MTISVFNMLEHIVNIGEIVVYQPSVASKGLCQ